MNTYLSFPRDFLHFWYIEAPGGLVAYFKSLNMATLHALSLPLFLRTFFKPLKNEYREGLVGFSIGMGIVVKSLLIVFAVCFLLGLIVAETLVLLLFLAFPIGTILILFT